MMLLGNREMLRLQKNEISSFPLTETKSKLTSDLTEFSLSQAQNLY